MSATATQLDLAALNQMFETSDPEKIVEWAVTQFANELVLSSSFGADSAVMLHMANQAKPGIRIVFVDTGYLFPETHAFMEQMRKRLDLNVWVYRTRNDPIAYLHAAGEENPTWRKDRDSCCAANKNEPFDRAIKELSPKAWLRGIRGDQTSVRAGAQFIEWAPRYKCHAISPILNWNSRDIHGYLKKHDLPYHPMREKGYLSIGCNPLSCTRTVAEGEDARSGRWAGQGKVECGINITSNSLDSANL